MHQVQGGVEAVTRFCSKCQQPIREGEEFTAYSIDAGSAAAMTVYWHKQCPKPATNRTRRP
jgi:hypothetical protein